MGNLSMKRLRKGFTLVEIMIVVLIIGIQLAIAIPNFIKARESSRKQTCITALKQIDSAKEQCAQQNKWDTWHQCEKKDLYPTYLKEEPTCPSGGTYTVGKIGEPPTCSYELKAGHKLP